MNVASVVLSSQNDDMPLVKKTTWLYPMSCIYHIVGTFVVLFFLDDVIVLGVLAVTYKVEGFVNVPTMRTT
jgi:hypothetical protein